jgi:hypothetical protein
VELPVIAGAGDRLALDRQQTLHTVQIDAVPKQLGKAATSADDLEQPRRVLPSQIPGP